MTKNVMIPRELEFQRKRILATKALLNRLEKGADLIEQAVKDRDYDKMPILAKTFKEVSIDVQHLLENALYFNEFLATGKKIIIRRNGRAEGMGATSEEIEVDVHMLEPLRELSKLFGPDAIEIIEIEEGAE